MLILGTIPYRPHGLELVLNLSFFRPLAINHIKFRIGNGVDTSLWFDPWMGNGILATSIHSSLVINSGLGPNATVSNIIQNSTWNFPSSNHNDFIVFRDAFDFNRQCNSTLQDECFWGNTKASEVRASTIWCSIRQVGMDLLWDKLVWHRILTPRFSFILWMAFHKGLRTMDRLLTFGLQVNPMCVLYKTDLESFDHLFFHCEYSFRVLVYILRHCGWRGYSRNWSSITNYLIHYSRPQFHHSLIHLGFAAVVHRIWTERNARIFSHKAAPVRTVVQEIMNMLKCKLYSYKRFQRLKEKSCYRHLVL